MRTLWIVNHYAGRPCDPGGTRHYSLAKHMRELDWRVVIVAADTDHPAGTKRWPPTDSIDATGDDSRALFHWIKTPEYHGNGSGRFRNVATFAAKCLPLSSGDRLPRPDVIMGSTVHPLAVAAARRLARRMGARFVYEIRDLWPETLIRMGSLSATSLPARILYRLETAAWRQAELIVTPLSQLSLYREYRNLPYRSILHLSNGVETSLFSPYPRRSYNPPVTLQYLGSLGDTDHVDVLVRAMAEVAAKNASIVLDIYGAGTQERALRQLASELGLQNVRFLGRVAHSEIPRLSARADAFVFPLRDANGLYTFGASPNKLHDYLAAGRPVLLNAPFPDDPVSRWKAGIVVQSCTPDAWSSAILQFAGLSIADRRAMGARARTCAEDEFDFNHLAKKLVFCLNSLENL